MIWIFYRGLYFECLNFAKILIRGSLISLFFINSEKREKKKRPANLGTNKILWSFIRYFVLSCWILNKFLRKVSSLDSAILIWKSFASRVVQCYWEPSLVRKFENHQLSRDDNNSNLIYWFHLLASGPPWSRNESSLFTI